jgi:hypothetical protein
VKFAHKVPNIHKSAVYVTQDRIALYYSRPVLLGHIEKRGQEWVAEDGTRFANNRSALEYLMRLYEMRTFGKLPEGGIQPGDPISEKMRKVAKKADEIRPVEKKKLVGSPHRVDARSLDKIYTLLRQIAGEPEDSRQKE